MSTDALTVLVVEDDGGLREALVDTLMAEELQVQEAEEGGAALEILRSQRVGLILSDVQMQPVDGYTLLREAKVLAPATPFIMMTAYGTIQQAVDALQQGAVDYLVKPFSASELVAKIKRYLGHGEAQEGVVAESPAMQRVLEMAKKVAPTDATVMIGGESGVGKEVVAQYIHRHSPRAGKPFVAINCAAIPENLLEATLFGYEKGAFTGAHQASPGKFEQAQSGVLLLDEVTEMPLGLQAKLLRVLQERELERVGGRKTIALDVRVLATSNRDLQQAVREGALREDLYYRLNVFPLVIPPLRERQEDVLPLARQALAHFRGDNIFFSPQAEARLRQYPWPGNIRELINVVQRAAILASGTVIMPEDLLLPKLDGQEKEGDGEGYDDFDDEPVVSADLESTLRREERSRIHDALKASGGNKGKAAELLGISPRTLRHKLQHYREAGEPIEVER